MHRNQKCNKNCFDKLINILTSQRRNSTVLRLIERKGVTMGMESIDRAIRLVNDLTQNGMSESLALYHASIHYEISTPIIKRKLREKNESS